MKQINLSICICVFNKFNFTKSCLDDLFKLSNKHEIIIVDNGSSDQTQDNLSKIQEDFNKKYEENYSKNIVSSFIYHRNEENLGFAKASNQAYNLSNGKNALFLNNDIKVKSNFNNWTDNLLKYCDNYLVGPTMGQLDKNLNFVQESNCVLSGNSYMSGWCLASSKEIWEKLKINNQIFSEDFFCYFEDTDLSFRARKMNIPFIVSDIPVVHFGKVSSKQLNTYNLYQNARKIFLSKWRNNG